MERILVNLNPSRGLAKKVNLQYKEFFFEQILDYEYFPFRCHRFHVYGHLAKECPIGRRRKRFQRTSAQFEKTVHQNVTFHLKEAIAQQTEEEMETDPNRGADIKCSNSRSSVQSGRKRTRARGCNSKYGDHSATTSNPFEE